MAMKYNDASFDDFAIARQISSQFEPTGTKNESPVVLFMITWLPLTGYQ